jgi:hypothetical protein
MVFVVHEESLQTQSTMPKVLAKDKNFPFKREVSKSTKMSRKVKPKKN